MKRDRTKPKHHALKAAIEAVLADPEQVSLLATASIGPEEPGVWWDEDGPHFEDGADWDARVKNVEQHLGSLLTIVARIPSPRKQSGGQALPGEPALTDLDKTILRMAREYAARTGKAAANGAVGQKISNQGGPFVKEVAAKVLEENEELEKAVGRVIACIDRMEKHPRLKALWDRDRDPNYTAKTFGPALRNMGLAD